MRTAKGPRKLRTRLITPMQKYKKVNLASKRLLESRNSNEELVEWLGVSFGVKTMKDWQRVAASPELSTGSFYFLTTLLRKKP